MEKEHYLNNFNFRAKALFAFEDIDGTDVCFFGMHVQEYGSECAFPNTRRVYIAYLDSVHFFKPRQFRTAVYHEILLGYLEYVKQLGYTMAHIWACPPSEGDDYIFHCHPTEQKIPKPKRLQEWYKKMLDKGIIERIVLDYKVKCLFLLLTSFLLAALLCIQWSHGTEDNANTILYVYRSNYKVF